MDDKLMPHVEKIIHVTDGAVTKLLVFMLTPAETKQIPFRLMCN
jgi:hypothetical protein